MYYFSVIIVIVASVLYMLAQKFIGIDINPIVSLCCMYLSGFLIAIPFYFKTKKKTNHLNNELKWRIILFSIANVAIDLGFLLAYRSGWPVSILNVTTNIAALIILTIIGFVAFKEKLTFINILGIITGIMGLLLITF